MLEKLSENKCFDGFQRTYRHQSASTQCHMTFGVFTPAQAEEKAVPVLVWLSGLTCTHENFIIKSHMQRFAAQYGIAVVNPDTSPRGFGYPGEDDSYDFGSGAGFYVDATEKPWSTGYQMYSYVTKELPALLKKNFRFDFERVGVFGHSMGGHGALLVALRNPDLFKSVSAFAPISSVIKAPWGQKALNRYLGDDMSAWQAYDVAHTLKTKGWNRGVIRVDFGLADEFLIEQLKPELLDAAAKQSDSPVHLFQQTGYDHSFFFINSFLEEHFKLHAEQLGLF